MSTSSGGDSEKSKPQDQNSSYLKRSYNGIIKHYEAYEKDSRQLGEDLQYIVEQLEKKKYDVKKMKYIASIVVVIILFMFWRTIKSFLSKETSDVAIKTINDEDVRKNLYVLLCKVLDDAKNDPLIAQQLVVLIKGSLNEALRDKETMDILQKIVSDVITSDQIKKDAEVLTKEVVVSQLKDDENKKLLTDLMCDSSNTAYERFKQSWKFW
ncbi:hypothetical protein YASMINEVIRUS_1147 [Yasminevirus sp. GU-2018]|uniref:Uncharacterized protein n=1 Tax=Yasminevirus sp. GU-2018 TaxID=2420051 RepID=A0A5K0UA90_9VIRU|nr:hypothetical protein YASMINEVIRUS_1147 [Yasminevirus sp. GU-2018]